MEPLKQTSRFVFKTNPHSKLCWEKKNLFTHCCPKEFLLECKQVWSYCAPFISFGKQYKKKGHKWLSLLLFSNIISFLHALDMLSHLHLPCHVTSPCPSSSV